MPPSKSTPRSQLPVEAFAEAVISGDRSRLAQAITTVESVHEDGESTARELLTLLLPHSGRSHRIGITGVPGVGKSTLIETLGLHIIDKGHRVAVLAVDPTSSISGGSILGDKSRMPQLANHPDAFVRPSPNALAPGGVGRRTRELQILCEAAGFDIVIIETVGVGQSEILVSEMVDTFVALMLPGAGDELQGLKKGVIELADVIVVNKADGDNRVSALAAKREYESALRYRQQQPEDWLPPVDVISARSGEGVSRLWGQIERHYEFLNRDDAIAKRREAQRRKWVSTLLEEQVIRSLFRSPKAQSKLDELKERLLAGEISSPEAVDELIGVYRKGEESPSVAED
ncbi:MAG: methylmalonyl Co-A mutase-associated GTPase MeaB [Acidobacteriota bacterium]